MLDNSSPVGHLYAQAEKKVSDRCEACNHLLEVAFSTKHQAWLCREHFNHANVEEMIFQQRDKPIQETLEARQKQVVGGPATSPFDNTWAEQAVNYHDNDQIDTNEQGGKQSHLEHRMDLLVPEMLLRVSHVLHVGAEKYGDENWHNIPNWRHHIGRAMYHCVKALQGAQDEDHMANAICRVMFAMWHKDHYKGPIYYDSGFVQDWSAPDNKGTGVK